MRHEHYFVRLTGFEDDRDALTCVECGRTPRDLRMTLAQIVSHGFRQQRREPPAIEEIECAS